MKQLSQLCDKNGKMLEISDTLLLSPLNDNINKSDRRIIKKLLFEFLSGTSRAL